MKLATLVLLHAVLLTARPTAATPTASPSPDRCFASPDAGPCDGALTRWHYDFATNACAPFTWGGCDGAVPFETLGECRAAQCGLTRCDQAPDPGPCRGSIPAYHYNATAGECQLFLHGGCAGTVPFATMARCERQCLSDPCDRPPRAGPCRDNLERYFYNATTEQCESFTYGGCRGLVPFETRSECRRGCLASQPRRRERAACASAPDPGPCRALFERYFYNSETMRCESFTWGGCDGNVPFETRAECRNAACNPLADPDDVTAGDDDDDAPIGFDINARPGPRIPPVAA